MIVVHTNDSHYDLVVSRNIRLAQKFLTEEINVEPESNELQELKEEHDKL